MQHKHDEKRLDMTEANRLKDQLDQLTVEEKKTSMMSAVVCFLDPKQFWDSLVAPGCIVFI